MTKRIASESGIHATPIAANKKVMNSAQALQMKIDAEERFAIFYFIDFRLSEMCMI